MLRGCVEVSIKFVMGIFSVDSVATEHNFSTSSEHPFRGASPLTFSRLDDGSSVPVPSLALSTSAVSSDISHSGVASDLPNSLRFAGA